MTSPTGNPLYSLLLTTRDNGAHRFNANEINEMSSKVFFLKVSFKSV